MCKKSILLRQAVLWSVLVLIGLLIGAIVAEASLRILGLAQPGFYTYDPDAGWTLRPGAHGWQLSEGQAYISVNRYGMRDRNHSMRKPPHVLRIAILGDSFTEAKQVAADKTFAAVIERELKTCPLLHGIDVETLNFGVDSYGTAQELVTLRRKVWQFSPDIIVLAICTGNDIRNDSMVLEGDKCQPFFVYNNRELVPAGQFVESAQFRAHCMTRFDSQRSALLNFLGHERSLWRAWRRGLVLAPVPGAELGLDQTIYREPADPRWRQAWDIAEGEIELVHQEAAKHGAEFLAVTLSNGIQVHPDPSRRRSYMEQVGITDLLYPDKRISVLGERDGFAVLNLAPPMQKYAEQNRVFLHGFQRTGLGVGHWNEQGHELAGKLMAARLCELLRDKPAGSGSHYGKTQTFVGRRPSSPPSAIP